MSRVRAVVAPLAVLLLAACPKAQQLDPFQINRAEFAQSVRRVAVVSAALPADLSDAERVRDEIDSLLVVQLSAAGYTVAPRRESEPHRARIEAAGGGIFDPVTGRADTLKARDIRLQLARELRDSLGVDAVVQPTVFVTQARLVSGWAHWLGARQQVQSFGSQVLFGGASGGVPALGLHVRVVGPNGDMYANAGGLEVIQRLGITGAKEVLPSTLFRDTERTASAVAIALKPMLERKAD
jgi:hypothetical protein